MPEGVGHQYVTLQCQGVGHWDNNPAPKKIVNFTGVVQQTVFVQCCAVLRILNRFFIQIHEFFKEISKKCSELCRFFLFIAELR
jgi:hypothetical protein